MRLLYSGHMELTQRLTEKVAKYKVSSSALDPIRQAPILLTAGITAAGKNAVQRLLLQRYPDQYKFIVSHVTRPMRDYESPDVQYHFVDFDTMEKMVDDQAFIEVNIVHAEHVYGSSIGEVENAQELHKIACSDITIEGVDNYVQLGLNVRAAFLLPPSFDIWKQRLMARYAAEGKIDHNDLKNRLHSAIREIQHGLDTDYYHIIINDDLSDAAEIVNRIAHGDSIETHEHAAVNIAQEILRGIHADLAKLANR
jgi:guanylate kinase